MPIWGMVLSALAEIRIGRVRVALSIFCVAVGVAAITLVTVVSGVSQQAAREVFEREVGRPVTLTAMPEPDNGPPRLADDTVQRVHDDLERYHITVSTLRETGGVSYRYHGRTIAPGQQPVITQAVDPALAAIRRLSIVSGRWLNDEDQARLEPQLVVNSGFAAALGLSNATAVGAEVEVGGAQLWVRSRIVGIIAASRMDGPGMQVYLP